jgi:ketosteroid isomerase-like protein
MGKQLTVMVAVAWLTAAPQRADAPVSPAAAADALLAADRAFSSAAASGDAVTGLTAMFAPGVIMPGPPGVLHRGLAAVTASLRANPDTTTGQVEWTPIRVGLSADGEHGFTFGFMTLQRPDGTRLPLKYMSYWVKGETGWRVAGYKRARRPEGDAATALMAPLLPARLMPASRDAARLEQLRQGLRDAERAFSNEAQQAGLGPAFVTWGSQAAVNMGGPGNASYVVGNTAIGALVGGDRPGPSPVEWSTDVALVASSGDLGISFGYIRPNRPPPAGAPAQGSPFFTIWHRPRPDGPWRYIAE